LEGLILFLLAVLFVALIGHGIWELLAWMFRGFQPRRVTAAAIPCPRCGKPTVSYPCRMCGFVPGHAGAAAAPRRSDLSVAREVIAGLAARGLIDEQTRSQVVAALRRASLTETHSTEATIPQAKLSHEASAPAEAVEAQTAQLRPLPVADAVPPAPPPPLHPAPVVPEAGAIPPAAPVPAPVPPPVSAPAPAPVRRPTFVPPPAPRPKPVQPPAKPFSEILRAFMLEKNIRWGELVGAVLIVGCSIAMVISLWAQISERPFLKVGVFTAVVAGLFGLGLYADRKWKIPTTSWGMLLTAMLLVPLHFGGMVVLGGGTQESLTLLVEAAGALVLAVLTYLAAGVIGPRWRLLLTGGVVVLSLLGPVLYVAGVSPAIKTAQQAMATTGALMGLYLLTAMMALLAIRRRGSDSALPREAMCLLGMLLAAVIPSLVMEWYFVRGIAGVWPALSPLLALLATPMLLGAGDLSRRIVREREGWRTGLWVTEIVAALAMAMWVVVAWPVPWAVVACSLALVVVFGFSGYAWRNAGQLTAAGIFLLIAYLAGLPAVMGRIAWDSQTVGLLEAIWTARFGIELIPAVVMLALLAAAVWRREKHAGEALGALAGTVAVLGLGILAATVYFAGMEVAGAAWVFGGYAVALVAGAVVL
jgi:hypothetical protein